MRPVYFKILQLQKFEKLRPLEVSERFREIIIIIFLKEIRTWYKQLRVPSHMGPASSSFRLPCKSPP